jgi:N utilization substance protein B
MALQFLIRPSFAAGGGRRTSPFWRHFPEKRNGAALFAGAGDRGGSSRRIDALIARYSEHWRLERMTVVDRNLLRLAIYRAFYQPQIPPKW